MNDLNDNNTNDFNDELYNWKTIIEEYLYKSIPVQNEFPPVIFEAMRYSLLMGGKRLRPMIILSVCNAISGDYKNAVPFAVAMEMIHTYSLIHDDLPCMDNDDLRRGKPTNHKVFGENMAVLAGDSLLSLSAEIMSEVCVQNNHIKNVKAMNVILKGAGVSGMLVGQVVDVFFEGEKSSEVNQDILDFIHLNKTAKMISASFESGAILGGADIKTQKDFALVGEKIGIAFQILDDVLDVTSTNEVLGKPVGSDDRNQKITYVTLNGIEKSLEIAKKLSCEAVEILQNINADNTFLIDLTNYLTKRKF